jgi:hypothetical protein
MTTTPARPDMAYINATRLDPAQLVTELRDLLGAKLVAYLGGVKETRAVRQWADGTRQVASGQDLRRLRLAYQAATLLAQREHPPVIQAWFQGLSPTLADRSPARMLREGDIDDVGPQVLAAARQFAAVG